MGNCSSNDSTKTAGNSGQSAGNKSSSGGGGGKQGGFPGEKLSADVNFSITYFDARGRAEIIRLIMAYKCKSDKYDDVRIKKEEWPGLKEKTPWESLPVIHTKDGRMLGQSMAIARYIAHRTDLAGADSWEEAQVDAIICGVEELLPAIIAAFQSKGGEDEVNTLVNHSAMTTLSKHLEANGGKYYVGNEVTYADLFSYHILSGVLLMRADALKAHPALDDHTKRIGDIPAVAEWVKNRPPSDF